MVDGVRPSTTSSTRYKYGGILSRTAICSYYSTIKLPVPVVILLLYRCHLRSTFGQILTSAETPRCVRSADGRPKYPSRGNLELGNTTGSTGSLQQ